MPGPQEGFGVQYLRHLGEDRSHPHSHQLTSSPPFPLACSEDEAVPLHAAGMTVVCYKSDPVFLIFDTGLHVIQAILKLMYSRG